MHKKRKMGFLARAKRVAILIFYTSLALVICFSTTVSAVSYMTQEEKIDYYSAIGIMFYDGTSKNACTRAGSCKVYGNTDDERLWSALRNVGFSPEETAAIMGNMKNEGATPVTQEGYYIRARNSNCKTQEGNPYTIWTYDNEHHAKCMHDLTIYYDDDGEEHHKYSEGSAVAGIGLGMAQWTQKERREGYLAKIRELGLLDKYFEGDAYKTWGTINTLSGLKDKIQKETGSDSDYWALFCAAVSYVYEEMYGAKNYAAKSLAGSTVEEKAGNVSVHYEACSGCNPGESSYKKRQQDAVAIWNRYQNGEFDTAETQLTGATLAYSRSRQNGTLIAAGGSGTDAGSNVSGIYNANKVNGSTVLIIGDQSVSGSSSALQAKMPGVNIQSSTDKHFTDSNIGSVSQTNIIISLGLNDSSITEEQAKLVVDNFKNKNIYFVLNYSDTDTSKYAANNATLGGISSVYSNVKVIDWPKAVADAKAKDSSKKYFESDGITPASPDGANLFASTIYQTLVGFDNTGTCGQYDPGDPLSFAKQFIIDTNYAYNLSLAIPQSFEYNELMSVPGHLNPTLNSEHATVLRGLFNGSGPVGTACWSSTTCGQCTALSQWFIYMLTEYSIAGQRGAEVVGALKSYPEIEILDHPEPLTIFSQYYLATNSDGSTRLVYPPEKSGHTGLIMDVKDDGTVITLENNMGRDTENLGGGGVLAVKTKTIKSFEDRKTVYAKIPLEKMHLEHLGQTYD